MAHQQWRNQLDYIITLLGFSVGSGTFIKFPFYCMRNGGGAFLIPFVLFTLIGAIPCVFLEMAIGQYSQSGPIKVWDICPAFKGIGVGCVLCSWMFYTYYNVLFSWITYYFYYSFYTILPWEHCGNAWNTPDCISVDRNSTRFNITDLVPDIGNLTSNSTPGITAAEEFWR
ncbi:sodium- and chloride-dependent creatine transporter 1-like [Haliotis rufescens]|uniref:sodium- and chloride-dependent creatine transporter 1-like n=1 Tax=Haliotis rufescens TaxID=6454 RepID=UPI00201F723A|nr:sodium- and chloride-dependent creatine transporter 1-like [Haliotis rufescens]